MARRSGAAIEEAEVKILGGSGYHLPTDSQWIHASRAGTETKYHFGDLGSCGGQILLSGRPSFNFQQFLGRFPVSPGRPISVRLKQPIAQRKDWNVRNAPLHCGLCGSAGWVLGYTLAAIR